MKKVEYKKNLYEFRVGKKEEFLKGRTIRYISQLSDFNEAYISLILSGSRLCSEKAMKHILRETGYSLTDADTFFIQHERTVTINNK